MDNAMKGDFTLKSDRSSILILWVLSTRNGVITFVIELFGEKNDG